MNTIKSITPVEKSGGWAVRVRFTDGSPAITDDAAYTLAQAQMACDSLRRDISNHGQESALATFEKATGAQS